MATGTIIREWEDDSVLTNQSFTISNISVNAGASKSGTVSVAKSGYTPIGICGYNSQNSSSGGTGVSRHSITYLYVSGTTLYWKLTNYYSVAMKIDFIPRVFYMKA